MYFIKSFWSLTMNPSSIPTRHNIEHRTSMTHSYSPTDKGSEAQSSKGFICPRAQEKQVKELGLEVWPEICAVASFSPQIMFIWPTFCSLSYSLYIWFSFIPFCFCYPVAKSCPHLWDPMDCRGPLLYRFFKVGFGEKNRNESICWCNQMP